MLCRLQIEDLLSIEWHAAVFDEAHKLKNDKSATYEAAAELRGVTKRLYGLTGTIMQVPFPVTRASNEGMQPTAACFHELDALL